MFCGLKNDVEEAFSNVESAAAFKRRIARKKDVLDNLSDDVC